MRIGIASATLGDVIRMNRAIVSIVSMGLLLAATAPVFAQGLPGGRPADAIDRARGLATQPFG
ncbi:MAG: hypothetical protein ACREJE_12710, partial [Candidatus Rokuibacteriota bacterium]